MNDGVAPAFQPRPIGSGNRANPDLRVNCDRAHGGYPAHLDVVVALRNVRMAHKIRVDEFGRIISDEEVSPLG
jgi:hypothetical protein